jgi:hypothetical protein
MIQLENYFFEVSDYDEKIIEIGNSNRSFSGKNHIDYINRYRQFQIGLKGISEEMHSNLLWLVSLNRGLNGEAKNLRYISLDNKEYSVDIGLNGYKFNIEKGKDKLSYEWNLTLLEV